MSRTSGACSGSPASAARTVPQIRTVHCLDDSHGIVDYPGEDYFAQILDAFLDATDSPRGLVGQARSELLDAGDAGATSPPAG